MVPELILIALLIGWIARGSFWRLADAKIKYGWMIFIPLGLYLLCQGLARVTNPDHIQWVFAVSAIIEKCALIVVALANLRVPGMKLIFLGIVLNLIALSVNGGFMPGSPDAVRAAFGADYLEQAKTSLHVRSALMDASSELGFLCDVIAAHRPFALFPAVYSAGDLVMSVGLFMAIIGLMRAPAPKRRQEEPEETVGSEQV